MDDSWRSIPDWAIHMLKLQRYIIVQNEAIQAKIEDRSTRLSDADQKSLNELMKILKGTNEKIDNAKKDE